MPIWKVSVVPIADNLCQFCCLKKGFGFGTTLQAPVFRFHFHLQSLVQEAEIGFHLVKAYSRVKFLAIDDNAFAQVLSHMVTHMVVLLANIPVLGFQRFCYQQMMKMRFEPPPVKEEN